MRKLLLAALSLSACATLSLSSLPVLAANPAELADRRVEALLQRSRLPYHMTPEHDFELNYTLETAPRAQTARIHSRTKDFNGLEMREVTSIAYRTESALSAQKANALLYDNDERAFGSWRMVRADNGFLVVFAAQIPADANDAMLFRAVKAVMSAADALEAQETGLDVF